MDTALREALFAIQRHDARLFARLLTTADRAAADGVCSGPADVSRVLGRRTTGSIRIGGLHLQIAESGPGLDGAPGPIAGPGCPLTGQVVLVTGAASGLGLAIATGYHQAGACVVLTDVDRPGLDRLAGTLGDGRAHAAVVDVTTEASVAAGFDAALARFGRLDAVACCAGVAPSFDLVDFPLDRFRLANEVNLVGYFLCAREAARIMRGQGHGGSMLMLSSKSGLEPSKANSAYNATKAGELHMARGWALELGRDGIRVNCIAPGNVFEGSKIWNPEYIAKAAQKKGISPDQVIPYYIGLTALNRDIRPGDIAASAVFLASDAARCITGQVLVVDSGQVWAR